MGKIKTIKTKTIYHLNEALASKTAS